MFVELVLVSALVVGLGAADFDVTHRLPNNTIPRHYNVQLRTEVHTGNGSYRGSVDIYVDIVTATHEIVLNAKNITVQSISLYSAFENENLVELATPSATADSDKEQLILTSSSLLGSGSYLLKIQFNGIATTSKKGVFMGSYANENNTQEYYLTAHFEPTFARLFFPCFDEPSLKATFNVSIVHHKHLTARSNMPPNGPAYPYLHEEEYVISNFYQTPRMSTYLLTFIVSNFVERTVRNRSVCSRSSVLDSTDFAMQASESILNALDEYTGLPYNDYMPKLTHLAIPGVAERWRAMENWGLVTYVEDYPLFNPLKDGYKERLNNLEVMAHELAHQWFGNLVTPAWWSHVWIKEGFATLLQFHALHLAQPSELFMDLFNVKVVQKGLEDNSEMQSIADDSEYKFAAYYKAGSMLNMFRLIAGDDKWRTIVRSFLRKHQFDSVTPEDLYKEVELVLGGDSTFPANKTVTEVFESWIFNAGTPVLRVRRLYSRGGKVIISQHRMQPCTESNESWIIPYSYAHNSAPFDGNVGPVYWLTQQAEMISTGASDDEWIVFNKQQFGAYRVNYDERNWQLIIQALRSNVSSIHRLNRAQLLDDAYNLHKTGQLDIRILLELMTYLRNETEYIPWYVANVIIYFMVEELPRHYLPHFKVFVMHLTEPFYQSFASSQISPNTPLSELSLQRQITGVVCKVRNKECSQRAKIAFQEAVRTNTPVHPDEFENVYCFGLPNASDAEFDWLLGQYQGSTDLKQLGELLEMLSCTNRIDRIRKVLVSICDRTFDDDQMREASFDSFSYGLEQDRVDGQLGRFMELFSNDTAVVDLLGEKYTKVLLTSMMFLASQGSENERNQLVDLVVGMESKFHNIKANNMRKYFSHKLDAEENADTLIMFNFLEEYVSELNVVL